MDEVVCSVCGRVAELNERGVAMIHRTSGSSMHPVWGPRAIHADCRDDLAAATGLDLSSDEYTIGWELSR